MPLSRVKMVVVFFCACYSDKKMGFLLKARLLMLLILLMNCPDVD